MTSPGSRRPVHRVIRSDDLRPPTELWCRIAQARQRPKRDAGGEVVDLARPFLASLAAGGAPVLGDHDAGACQRRNDGPEHVVADPGASIRSTRARRLDSSVASDGLALVNDVVHALRSARPRTFRPSHARLPGFLLQLCREIEVEPVVEPETHHIAPGRDGRAAQATGWLQCPHRGTLLRLRAFSVARRTQSQELEIVLGQTPNKVKMRVSSRRAAMRSAELLDGAPDGT